MAGMIRTITAKGTGMQVAVRFGEWRVAYLSAEDRFDLENFTTFERHKETDETFVLLEGVGWLVALDLIVDGADDLQTDFDGRLEIVRMEPSTVYNVPLGLWHHVVLSEDARVLIVENGDTCSDKNEYRDADPGQVAEVAGAVLGSVGACEESPGPAVMAVMAGSGRVVGSGAPKTKDK